MCNTDCEEAADHPGGAHPSTKIFLEQVAINNILEEEPCSQSPMFTNTRGPNEEAFQASVRRHLGQGRRRGGGARGDENWRIQLNFFIVDASCIS